MRVEAAPFVFRSEDRRKRPDAERRGHADRRSSARSERRARHTTHAWHMPAFAAHLLGQAYPNIIDATVVTRAYTQPESRTPLRPRYARVV